MRFFLALLMLLPVAALAGDWSRYENARFGYAIDIPPGYSGGGEADNSDGQVFTSFDGTALLRVYGGNNLEDSFKASLTTAMGYAADAGWVLSYKRVTANWASYSGVRGNRILYARAIALCGGTQFAAYELEYPVKAANDTDAAIKRLNASLKETGASASC